MYGIGGWVYHYMILYCKCSDVASHRMLWQLVVLWLHEWFDILRAACSVVGKTETYSLKWWFDGNWTCYQYKVNNHPSKVCIGHYFSIKLFQTFFGNHMQSVYLALPVS